MARRYWEDGAEVSRTDLNNISAAIERNFFDRVFLKLLADTEDAFFGDGFLVTRTDADTISIAAGVGFQSDNTKVSPEPEKRLLFNASAVSRDITAADATNDRIDIVSVKAELVDELTETRKVKALSDGSIADTSVVTQKNWEADIVITDGTPAGSPSAPSTPAGYVKIAEILVTAATGIASAGDITDTRIQLPLGGGFFDFDEKATAPKTPASGKVRLYFNDAGLLKYKLDDGTEEELVEKDATQTLTNKTIDGDDNTVQDIPLEDQSSGSATANQMLFADGSGGVSWNDPPGGLIARTVYTSNGTYTKATNNPRYIRVICVGGGGGGASANGMNNSLDDSPGSGGGGGGYAEAIVQASSLGASETVTVGSGGAGGTSGGSGSAGSASSLGSHCSASGGSGGTAMSTGSSLQVVPGGSGGAGTVGDVLVNGDAGHAAVRLSGNIGYGGRGGGSVLGASTLERVTNGSGLNGRSYGGGGSGGQGNTSLGSPGGTGANGVVIIEEYA